MRSRPPGSSPTIGRIPCHPSRCSPPPVARSSPQCDFGVGDDCQPSLPDLAAATINTPRKAPGLRSPRPCHRAFAILAPPCRRASASTPGDAGRGRTPRGPRTARRHQAEQGRADGTGVRSQFSSGVQDPLRPQNATGHHPQLLPGLAQKCSKKRQSSAVDPTCARCRGPQSGEQPE
jgi:hypothetical protein